MKLVAVKQAAEIVAADIAAAVAALVAEIAVVIDLARIADD